MWLNKDEMGHSKKPNKLKKQTKYHRSPKEHEEHVTHLFTNAPGQFFNNL